MMRRGWLLGLMAGIVAVASAQGLSMRAASAQPLLPAQYSGRVGIVGSSPILDGLLVTARIEEYVSQPVVVSNGRYQALLVAPGDSTFSGKTITFHLDGVQANETDTFTSAKFSPSFDLTFPRRPEPTPTPTIAPTATPIPTATPERARPAVYSGPIAVVGSTVPKGAVLVARIGSYESPPALIQGQDYRNLVVDPNDISLVGQTIEFFLNGVKSGNTDEYESGKFSGGFGLVFEGVPAPTPTQTPVGLIPASTSVAVSPTVSPTPILQHPAPLLPTPTSSPVPPSPTAVLPTSTPTTIATPMTVQTPGPAVAPVGSAPARTPTPSSGFCGSALGRNAGSSGVGNLLALLAPLALIAGYRRVVPRSK